MLQPDWVVLRPVEYENLGDLAGRFETEYVAEALFDASERFQAYGYRLRNSITTRALSFFGGAICGPRFRRGKATCFTGSRPAWLVIRGSHHRPRFSTRTQRIDAIRVDSQTIEQCAAPM